MQPEGDAPNEYASKEATLSLLDMNPILTNSSKLAQQSSQPIQLIDWISLYASIPHLPRSRPTPLILKPPKGASI